MKYNDKQTQAWRRREFNRSLGEDKIRSEQRQIRRKLKKFGERVMNHVDKNWWLALTDRQKEQVYHDWQYSAIIDDHLFGVCKFKDWITKIRLEITPDRSRYREEQLKNLI